MKSAIRICRQFLNGLWPGAARRQTLPLSVCWSDTQAGVIGAGTPTLKSLIHAHNFSAPQFVDSENQSQLAFVHGMAQNFAMRKQVSGTFANIGDNRVIQLFGGGQPGIFFTGWRNRAG